MKALILPEVSSKTGMPRSSIYAAMARGLFPLPARAGRRSIWSEEEIDAWLAERFAERDLQRAQEGA